MGGAERRTALLDAKREGGKIWLEGGHLVGVTSGSTYDLYASTSAALDGPGGKLATATVAAVESGRALLTLAGPAASALPARLVARESAHAFGEEKLIVRDDTEGADSGMVASLLHDMDFVKVGEAATLAVVKKGDEYKLVGRDGIAIAALGAASEPDFANRLRTSLEKVARVQALLALRTDAGRSEASFCIGNDLDANAFACAPASRSYGPTLKLGEKAKLIAVNRAAAPRYVYVFAIDENYAVDLVLPDEGDDPAVPADRPVVAFGAPDTRGRLTFLTLASDQPIKASVLEQSGAGARDPSACNSALARALCAAQRGTRDPSVPRVGAWTATVSSAVIR
jgi:hypothetical protein